CFVTSCGKSWKPLGAEVTTIRVSASPTPHAEILKAAQPLMKEQGYELIIKEYTDYIQPNLATEDGDVDANYFQHGPYLEEFNIEQHTHLVSVGKVHYEPFAIYKGNKSSLTDIADGDKILVPNDTTNEARALLLLQEAGLITLKENVGLTATKKDIVENPHHYDIVEMEAAQVPLNRKDAAFAVINGNYALQAGLSSEDALQYESSSGLAAQTYANVLVVREGNQNHKAIQALYQILTSDTIKSFVIKTYQGAVVSI
ncbi:ABC transporter substrate-binding protein, partial [bacterium]|nr:ABC transporter substrate-binding protein [bacterium]